MSRFPARAAATLAAAAALVLASATAVPAQTTTTVPSPPADGGSAPISAYGYGDTPLRGMFGRADLFFVIPPGARPAGDAAVTLEISHSPLLSSQSTVTLVAGDVSLASVALTPENANRGRLAARVPADLVGENGLAVSVRSYMRLTDDACEDPDNPALWATVHRTSAVQFAVAPTERGLEDVAALLTGPDGRRAVRLEVATSPGADELRAAGAAAAQIGRWQGARHVDALVGLAGADPALAPSVVVAAGGETPPGFPVTWTGQGYATAGGTPVDGNAGLLALAQTGPPSLLVGGTTPAAAARAADHLGTGLFGPVVTLDGPQPAPPNPRSEPWREGAASFAQLGAERREVTGIGASEVTFPFDRPPGWAVDGDATLDLVVEAGAGLDRARSTVQVEVAGVDVGSARLVPGGNPATHRFAIPAGLVDRRLDGRPLRTLDVTLRFRLEVPHGACEPISADQARAAVLPQSAFRLPHKAADRQEVGRFPYPLADDDSSRITILLPNEPDRQMVAAGVQLAAAVGRWLPASAPAPVLTTVAALDRRAALDSGLILVGGADGQLGERLDVGDPPNAGPGQAAAVIGLVPSPLDDDRAALVIRGDGAGALLAARTLASRTGLEELDGSRAAIRGDLPPVALADGNEGSPPPELAPVIGGRSFLEERSWAVPAVVVLVALLAVLVLLARARWGRKARNRRALRAAADP